MQIALQCEGVQYFSFLLFDEFFPVLPPFCLTHDCCVTGPKKPVEDNWRIGVIHLLDQRLESITEQG